MFIRLLGLTPLLIASASFAQAPAQEPVVIGGPPPALVGEPVREPSRCDNMAGAEKERCLKEERSRVGNTGGRAAGAGGTAAPGSTGTGHGSMGAQNVAPAGSAR